MLAISLLLAVGLAQTESPRERDFWLRAARCGFVFNVDGPGSPGDGIYLGNDRSVLIEKRPHERAKRECLESWATRHGFTVRYIPVRK